jgi:hypothetical protein
MVEMVEIDRRSGVAAVAMHEPERSPLRVLERLSARPLA